MRLARKLAAVAAASAAIVTMNPVTAHAAYNLYAPGDGVAASANAVFSSTTTLRVTEWRLNDKACDGNDVYSYFRLYTRDASAGYNYNTPFKYYSGGCNGGADLPNVNFFNTTGITGAKLYSCKNDAGADPCWYTGTLDNPYL